MYLHSYLQKSRHTYFLEYIDITELQQKLKKQHPFKPYGEVQEIIRTTFKDGLIYKGFKIDVLEHEYYSPLVENNYLKFYFKCPVCSKKCLKLYAKNNFLGCRTCGKIRPPKKKAGSQGALLDIQSKLRILMNPTHRITQKKKNKLIGAMTLQYKSLTDDYKMAYNSILFKELLDWCAVTSIDNNKSHDYKAALKDVMNILHDARKLLILWGLGKSRFKKLDI